MKNLLGYILTPIVLNTVGEILLRANLKDLDLAFSFTALLTLLQLPLVLLAGLMIFVGTILWLVALSRYELSFLYPFLSLNYLGILWGSQHLLSEAVGGGRYVAVLLILLGLIIISRSPNADVNKNKTKI